MSWRDAFLRQAASDNEVRTLLNRCACPYSHQLHYLQMVTEKLAKGYAQSADDDSPPAPTHTAFVRLLQTLKSNSEIRTALGFETNRSQFVAYINGLLPLAHMIQSLAPSVAGFSRPNPEYPWDTDNSGEIVAPVDYPFEEFDGYSVKMMQLDKLIDALLKYAM